jgi:fucose permease
MIRIGQIICICGALLLIIPYPSYLQLAGLILVGLGCAPIYPAMLHETPNRFGKEISQGIMGIQMATAYVGSTLMPPLFGMIAKATTFNLLPYFLVVLVLIMFVTSERVSKVCKDKMV